MIGSALLADFLAFSADLQRMLLLAILILNLISFFMYYRDKQKAIRKKRRIPEKHLLRSAWLLGGVGAWLAMRLFRHKTLHPPFKYGVPLAALLTMAALYLVITQV